MYLKYIRLAGAFLGPVLFALISVMPLPAQALQALVTKNIFYAPSGKGLSPYLEAYWEIDPQSILFKKEAGIWQGRIMTDVVISSSSGVVAEDHYILATPAVTEGVQTLSVHIMDLRRYQLKPGHFTLQVRFSDQIKTGNIYNYTDSFTVEEAGTQPMLSDIQIIDTILASQDNQNIFQRNGRLQIPLSGSFFDERRKAIHYYAEAYGSNTPDPADSPLVCKTFISKKEFEFPYQRITRTDTLKPVLLQILEGRLPIASLPSGNYYLNMVIENNRQARLSARSFFFQVMNPKPEAPSSSGPDTSIKIEAAAPAFLDLNKTYLGKYTPAQIRAILKMLLPVADPNEKLAINGFIRKPDDTYARYFIYNFWIKRNKLEPEKTWREYAEKIKQVNKLFGSSMLPGYENDRGIIFLKYGEPTERITVDNENGALPYEVWQYNQLPGATNAVFLFYKSGVITNDYRLLHSTVNGEIRNKSWRSSLYQGGAAIDANNSRAEQYLGNR